MTTSGNHSAPRSTLEEAEQLLAAQGLVEADDRAPDASGKRFADGGHFRLEISGVERLSTLEAMLAEADRLDLHIHRAVSFGLGATMLDLGELAAFAELARDHDVEVVAVPGPRGGWDTGRQALTPEGMTAGRRIRGADNLRYLLADYLRCFEAGLRGVLVWDEGMLDILNKARERGDVPGDAFFKVSVYTGHANAAAARVVEGLGADSINPVGDLSRPMLAGIRAAIDVPLDIWAVTFDSFGGMNRLWEAGAIAGVAAPCYFKIEPGTSEGEIYNTWTDPAFHERLVREKVRQAKILLELVARTCPGVEQSPRAASIAGS
jgi:hypothetical protein